jgi:hypothetical protein
MPECVTARAEIEEKATTMKFTTAAPENADDVQLREGLEQDVSLASAEPVLMNDATLIEGTIMDGMMSAAGTNLNPLLPLASSVSATHRKGKSKRARRLKRNDTVESTVLSESEYRVCLEQAEICRTQARDAARLKRWKAARGLFETAMSLCQRALGMRRNNDEEKEAQEYLHQLNMEVSTYSELAKSMERPLMPAAKNSTALPVISAAPTLSPTMPLAAASPSFSNAARRH